MKIIEPREHGLGPKISDKGITIYPQYFIAWNDIESAVLTFRLWDPVIKIKASNSKSPKYVYLAYCKYELLREAVLKLGPNGNELVRVFERHQQLPRAKFKVGLILVFAVLISLIVIWKCLHPS